MEDFESFLTPPEENSVFIPFDAGLTRIDEMNEWLRDNCQGRYVREIGRLRADSRETGLIYHFHDADTAIYFKLMFA